MIKINLFGEEVHNQEEVYFWAILYALGIILVLAICIIAQRAAIAQRNLLTDQRHVLQLELMNLRKTTKSVRNLKDKKEKLQNKLKVVGELKKSKIGPVRVMDDLNISMPTNVWIREMIEADGVIRIKGRALDNTDITTLMRELGKSKYFSSIDLLESRQMFYSKSTGKVSPMPQIDSLRSEAFEEEQRNTKEEVDSKVKITSKNKELGDKDVKIKEFLLQAKVSYSGKIDELKEITSEEAVK